MKTTLVASALLILSTTITGLIAEVRKAETEPRNLTTDNGAIAFSPDGKLLMVAPGTRDRVVTIWDVESGLKKRTLAEPAGLVLAVDWADNGQLLGTGADGNITLWEAATGRKVHVLGGHKAVILSIDFAPDNKTVASGGADQTIRLWDLATRRTVRVLPQPRDVEGAGTSRGTPGKVFAVAFSPDGTILASGAGDGLGECGELVLWNSHTGEILRRLRRPNMDQVWALAFSPDGKWVASGSTDGAIKVFEVETGNLHREWNGEGQLRALTISPDGQTLAAAIQNNIKLWELDTGKLQRVLSGHPERVGAIAFSPSGKLLATSARDGIKLWNLNP